MALAEEKEEKEHASGLLRGAVASCMVGQLKAALAKGRDANLPEAGAEGGKRKKRRRPIKQQKISEKLSLQTLSGEEKRVTVDAAMQELPTEQRQASTDVTVR